MYKNIYLKRFFSNPFFQSKLFKVIFCILISWFYAICSQVAISLPIGPVPIYLQPFPVLLLTFFLGKRAIYSYILFLVQGALGAPFFSNFGSLDRLLGPSGGYLFGFLFSILFIYFLRKVKTNSFCFTYLKLFLALIIYNIFGLFQLSFFVGFRNVFYVGLYPFLFGDLVKILCVTVLVFRFTPYFANMSSIALATEEASKGLENKKKNVESKR